MSSSSKLLALVTGGNKGIGYEAIKQLLDTGKFDVLLTARNAELGKAATEQINKEKSAHVKFYPLDVTSSASINDLVSQLQKDGYEKLDVLVNNAGWASKGSALTKEIALTAQQTNYYGLVNVTEALLPLLKKAPHPKIINVSSRVAQINGDFKGKLAEFTEEKIKVITKEKIDALMNEFVEAVEKEDFSEWPRNGYKASKLGVNAWHRMRSRQLAEQEDTKHIVMNACCPGWCSTDMGGKNAIRTPTEGAEVITFLATHDVGTGGFFGENKPISY